MFNFRKKPIITVTFDPYHNLPMMQAKNCTEEQIFDAGVFMKGHAKIDCRKNRPVRHNARRRKKESVIHKFFRILGAIIFGDETPTVEERIKRPPANYRHANCRHQVYPDYPEKQTNAPIALPAKV